MRAGWLLLILLIPVAASGGDLYEERLDSGLRNADAYSYFLITQAHRAGPESGRFLQSARQFSPDLPAVYFAQARGALSFSWTAIFDSIDHVTQGIQAYWRNFWWSFSLAGIFLFSGILSLLMAVAVVAAIRLFADLPLVAHDIQEAPVFIVLLALVVLLSALSPLLLLAGIFVAVGVYMRRIDRAVVYFFLFVLLAAPFVLQAVSLFSGGAASGVLKAVVGVNESRDNGLAVSRLKDEDGRAERFSYALALKRQGRYEEAAGVYEGLRRTWADPRVSVNLGNCYVGLNNLEEAKRWYLHAVSMKPLASAYYNLSQVFRETFDFPQGDEYFKKALEVDRVAVSRYAESAGRHPNRIVVDETLSFPELWEVARGSALRATRLGVSVVPSWGISVIAILASASFFLLNKRMRHRAYRCKRCDVVLCPRCEKRFFWGQMCPQCYRSLVKLDELDARERVARLLSIYEHQRVRRARMRGLSLFLPGAPQVYAGKILPGFLLLWPFLFFLMVPVMNVLTTPGDAIQIHSFFIGASLMIAGMIYLFSNMITRRRIVRGWL